MEEYTKVIKKPRWMAWVQRPIGLIKMELSTSSFKLEIGNDIQFEETSFCSITKSRTPFVI
jgi:hypothetical protein